MPLTEPYDDHLPEEGSSTAAPEGGEEPGAGAPEPEPSLPEPVRQRIVTLTAAVLPGLVDTHSHAFHRALRGRGAGGDFWAWRAEMYALVDRLDPDRLVALAAAAFG